MTLSALPLPDVETFFQTFWSMAFPQITLWASAAGGALLTLFIIKSLANKT